MASVPDSAVFVLDTEELSRLGSLVGKNIVVVIPAHNEARLIGSVILGLEKFKAMVIVVDDGSSDNTAEISLAAGARVIRHATNMGKGAALTTGFREAAKHKPDVVVMIDADGQHQPEALPGLISPILEGSADIVIGSRYLGDHSNVPKSRILGHWFFNLMTKTSSGTIATDSQSGYRAFSPRAMESIAFSSEGFSVESEMQFIANENQLVLEEIPIKIDYQEAPKRSLWAQGMNVLSGVLRLIGQYRPLLFFGVPGIVIMAVGFAYGVRVVDIFRRTSQLAVGSAMISVMLAIIGSIGISTGIILHSVRGLLVSRLRK